MANNSIYITTEEEQPKKGLEVYRDISLIADLNQANIRKSYREIIPTAYLANDVHIGLCLFKNIDNNADEQLTEISSMFLNEMYNKDTELSNCLVFEVIKNIHTVDADHANHISAIIQGKTFNVGERYVLSASNKDSKLKIKDIDLKHFNNTDSDFQFIMQDYIQYLHGDKFHKNREFGIEGFYIDAQYADKYYVEEYDTDINEIISFLATEKDKDPIIDENIIDKTMLMLFKNEGAISSYNEWKETKMWNPYKLAKLVNVKAIYNSLHNIFTWNPGERILDPEFGSKLKTYLYEGITDFNVEQIIAEIRSSISKFEPRVSVQNIINATNINDIENNTIQIDIIFTVPTLSYEQFVYSYRYNKSNLE